MFKKALISLGTLGVIGGSGVGVYYVVEKNKILDAAISSTAKNSSEISTQQISVVNPVSPTDVRTEGNHEPSIQPQSQQQSVQTNLDNAVHKPEVDAAAQVGGTQSDGDQGDGVQGGSSQAGTSPADDAGRSLSDSNTGGSTSLEQPSTVETEVRTGEEGSDEKGTEEEAEEGGEALPQGSGKSPEDGSELS